MNPRWKNQEFTKLTINSVHWTDNLEMRKKEHFRNLRLNQTEKSAIASHFGTQDIKLTIQLIY